ncbi:MAG: hypothetical protein AAI946_00395 [Candidatus Hodgkinia cicadicola]
MLSLSRLAEISARQRSLLLICVNLSLKNLLALAQQICLRSLQRLDAFIDKEHGSSLNTVLRCLSCGLFFALVVSILYGSLSVLHVMSLINTPIYENSLLNVYSRLANALQAAFRPATKPCALASS